MQWTAGDVMCKFFSFMNVTTLVAHSTAMVLALLFLYYWYRKQEAYMTEDGQTVVRKNK